MLTRLKCPLLTHTNRRLSIAHSPHQALRSKMLTKTQVERYNTYLNSLRLAVGNKDLPILWSSYMSLKRDGNLHRIGLRQCESLAQYVSNLVNQAIPRSPGVQMQAEQLALTAAYQGASVGLLSIFKDLILQNKPERVLELYSHYKSGLEDHQSLCSDTTADKLSEEGPNDVQIVEGRESSIKASPDSVTGATRLDPCSHDMLICAVLASAMKKSFSDAIAAVKDVLVKPNPENAESLLEELTNGDQQVQSTAALYLRDLALARLLTWPSVLEKHLRSLVKGSNFISLERLWYRISSLLEDPEGWIGLDGKKGRPFILPHQTWPLFMMAFSRLRRVDYIQKVWSTAIKLGMEPSSQLWNTLLQAYCEGGTLTDITSAWTRMQDAEIVLNLSSYIALCDALWRLGKPDRALRLHDDISRTYSGPRDDLLGLYNVALRRLLLRSDPSHAFRLLEDMDRLGPAPTKETYNIVLKFHQSEGNLPALVSILETMSAKGVYPDVASFTIVLNGLLQSGRSEPVQTLLGLMASFNVVPNTVMMTSIMHHLLRKGDKENLKTASHLLLQMESDHNRNRRPNEVTYTQLMDAFYSCPHISASEAEAAVEELWQRMLRFRIRPNRTTFEVLIKAAFRNKNAKLAMKYFHQQRDRQIPFTVAVFDIMFRNLILLNKIDFLHDVINELTASRNDIPSSLKKYISWTANHNPRRFPTETGRSRPEVECRAMREARVPD